MDLTVTDLAEVQLIFDEQTGDIIKGRGEGNIRLGINREGEFTMYGGYQIVRGEEPFYAPQLCEQAIRSDQRGHHKLVWRSLWRTN